MTKPNLLFVMSQMLGWGTYCGLLEEMARKQTDFRAEFYRYRYSKLLACFCKKIHAPGFRRHLCWVDPMLIAGLHIKRWQRKQRRQSCPDAVHCVTQMLGLAFVQEPVALSVTADCTRKLAQAYFATQVFSRSDVAREQRIFNRCHRVMTLTRWAAASVEADYAIPAERVEVIGGPVRVAADPSSGGRPQGKRLARIGFVGSDFVRKGGADLVRWHQAYFRDSAELHIVSVGAPAMDLPNVFVHGKMPHQQVTEEFFPSLDLFCLPTKKEMAGFVFGEAAAAGVPSITFDTGGTAEFVRHEQTGIVVPANDSAKFVAAIQRLLNEPEQRLELGRQARRIAEQEFECGKHFRKVFDLILAGIMKKF